ncbi:MAG: phosphoribosylformylglycinamidine synthase subunit PurQ [Gallionella sp.]|nr:phosphoribosylformylglycinamidine synthase subunit PurQ [Gallionella sp.]
MSDFWQRREAQLLVSLRYVDNRGNPTETYPLNPNGSPQGITGLTTPDGRFSIMMPHPERVFRAVQNSWYPSDWQENGASTSTLVRGMAHVNQEILRPVRTASA